MGNGAAKSQALTTPPYLVSFFVVILTAFLSDRYKSRSVALIIHALCASLGYLLLALSSPSYLNLPSGIRYFTLFPTTIGFFSAITLIITWTLNNQPSATKKGMGLTILNVVGQCGPLVGTRLYPKEEGPFYEKGMAVCAGAMLLVALGAVGLRSWLMKENRRLDREQRRKIGRREGSGEFRFMV